ncbi:hypothetical protein yaldo0001_1360 [Yersinia aldovae ATCC 35236]|nr:hypothetical protein yaldo0001_1360 [Yersinia aldovae ATCC 35236]
MAHLNEFLWMSEINQFLFGSKHDSFSLQKYNPDMTEA